MKRSTPFEVLLERTNQSQFKARYYTPQIHQASFVLPEFIQQLLQK